MDPYQSCPCGSGKSFKWCCQAYYPTVEKARKQHADGQHETALRTIQQLVQQHPNLAAPLGFQAELLYLNGKPEEADEVLQKAFAISPEFPFGHWLRGVIRKDEGETIGSLLELRKAAESYDPKAHQALAEINAAIFDSEMRLNRPVAARAALERAIHHDPAVQQLRAAFDNLFGEVSRMPKCARKAYTFRAAEPGHAESWKKIIPDQENVRLGEAAAAFEKLTALNPADAAAWFNLGLVRAWLGSNGPAMEALQESINREDDEAKNTEAGALIEVLRCGDGMQEQADYLEHRVYFQIQNADPLSRLLGEWQTSGRMTSVDSNEESGVFSCTILEPSQTLGVGIGSSVSHVAAYLMIARNIVRLWNSNKDALNRLADEVAARLGPSASPPMHETGFADFGDVALEAVTLPTSDMDTEEMGRQMERRAGEWFEDVWLQRPMKSLSNISPLDAAGSANLRKRLPGLIRFMDDCFTSITPRVVHDKVFSPLFKYDFNRVRRKLGLSLDESVAPASTTSTIDAMSTSELAALAAESLNDDDLDLAFRSALKLDAGELAGKFARLLTERPATADRHLPFQHLMQLAQADNNADGVLSLLDRAESADLAFSGGQRRNDYALRRGQVLARKGDLDKSHEIFQSLLEREANELKYYGPAIEAMLAHKQGQRALQFAEKGLAQARSQNNRDSEQYFMELAAAARKLG